MIRAFQWDLARQVERLPHLLSLLPRYAEWGYHELYLHLENAVEYPSIPGLARADAYSHANLLRLVETASAHGIRTVPIVNLLGHTQYIIDHPDYHDLNELRAADGSPLPRGQICPLHPRIPELVEKLLRDTIPFCTAGKIHLGLDESFHLGKCPRCRADIAAHGLARHFANHVTHLHTLTSRLAPPSARLQIGLWADMLNFIPEAIPLLPRGLAAYDWYYYPFSRHPRVELFNFAESDLAPALRAQGIDTYGCPMNGAFRFEPLPLFRDRLANLTSWWKRCHTTHAAGFLVTSWEAYRLAHELTTVVDAAAASLWLDPATDDPVSMLAHGYRRALGLTPATALRAARTSLACDETAFAGYARWETNDRWDVASPRDPASRYAREHRLYQRLAEKLPTTSRLAPLTSSLRLRATLAARDTFIRDFAQRILRLRRAAHKHRDLTPALNQLSLLITTFATELRAGRRAARDMWKRTRDPKIKSQNELLLDADTARLRALKAWLARVRRNPAHAHTSSPVLGAWQLTFRVHNHAPALQRISVEQQQPGGEWRELRSRYTIEFRAEGARPRSPIVREFSLGLDDPHAAPLRLTARGLGTVIISGILCTNGLQTLTPNDRRHTLGVPAPTSGFPQIDDPARARHLTLIWQKTSPA